MPERRLAKTDLCVPRLASDSIDATSVARSQQLADHLDYITYSASANFLVSQLAVKVMDAQVSKATTIVTQAEKPECDILARRIHALGFLKGLRFRDWSPAFKMPIRTRITKEPTSTIKSFDRAIGSQRSSAAAGCVSREAGAEIVKLCLHVGPMVQGGSAY